MNDGKASAPAHAPAMIELRGLTKDYGHGRGVFGLTLEVPEGQVCGFLGANGAGKTVTMRTLMGFIRAGRGSARIAGLDCYRDRARIQRDVGYLPGEVACPAGMTGREFLRFMARLKGLRGETTMRALIDRFELDPSARIGRMSKGTKQKVALVCAFMGRSRVLLLDEPTSGFDPLIQERFVDLVREERERGATVLLSSHIFPEVERTCDRVAFVRAGRLAGVESMDEVRGARRRVYGIVFADAGECARYRAAHMRSPHVVVAAVRGDAEARAADGGAARVGSSGPGLRAGAHGTPGVGLEATVVGDVGGFIADLAGYRVVDLTTREQTLEETFLHIYDGATAGRTAGRTAGHAGRANGKETRR